MMGAILILEEDMKKTVFSILVIALMITACSSTPTPAPVAAQAATESSTTAASSAPAAAQNAGGKVLVNVSEGDNWVKSDLTTFTVGVKYVFTVTNTGHRAHIFSISQPVTDISASGIDAAKNGALLLVSQDQLVPGAVITVEYTFTKPAPAGTLEFACLILMHYKMGQHLPIVVDGPPS
jgi:uncharacterized cupredoxin-like copper-binding protein